MVKPKSKPTPPKGPAWTKAQRAALLGARKPHPFDAPPPPTTRAEGFQAFLREFERQEKEQGPVRLDSPTAEELWAPLQRSIDGKTPPDKLDPVTEMLRAKAVLPASWDIESNEGLRGLIAFWIDTGGVEFLFELARDPRVLDIGTYLQGSTRGRWFDATDRGQHSPNQRLGVFDYSPLRTALRQYFFALSEEAFAAQSQAFARAQKASFDRAPDDRRDAGQEDSFVAFVLGRDGSYAHRLIVPGPDGRVPYLSNAGLMLASVTDLAKATALVDSLASILAIEGAACALNFVETFGAAAAPLLEKILAANEGRKPKLKPYYVGRFNAAIKLARTDTTDA